MTQAGSKLQTFSLRGLSLIGQEGPMEAAKAQKQSQFYDCCCVASESQQ